MAMGRPRAFEMTEALDRAMGGLLAQRLRGRVSRRPDQAMGINSPSLYGGVRQQRGAIPRGARSL